MSSTKLAMGSGKSSEEKTMQKEENHQQKTKNKKAIHTLSASKCYDIGLQYLNSEKSNFFIVFDSIMGRFRKHIIYVKQPPQLIKGMNYDHNWRFKPLKPVNSAAQIQNLREYIDAYQSGVSKEQDDAIKQFWLSFCNPSKTYDADDRLDQLIETMLMIEKGLELTEREKPFRLYHSFDNKSNNPISFVPPVQSFPAKLREEITFEKLFPMFPEHELGLFKLWLGRVGIGPSNHIPAGWQEPVFHTSRIGLVILGKQAGLGKSYQLSKLRSALAKVGMTMESIRSTGERFGIGRFVKANVAYKDDTDVGSLNSLVKSEITKTIISGGEVIVEDKFVNAAPALPICAVCVNANKIDMNTVYELDPGIIDRVKILNTRTRAQLNEITPGLYPDPSDRPESLEPAKYLPWLANKYECDVECLILWGLRMATDEFWELIKDGDVIKLRELTHFHANRCKVRFMPHVRQAVMRSFIISLLLTNENDDLFIPELNHRLLHHALKAFKKIQGGLVNVCEPMKQSWEKANRDCLHHWQGFREVWLPSVQEAIEAYEAAMNTGRFNGRKLNNTISEIVDYLYTRGGQKIAGGYSYLREDWEDARMNSETLREEAKSIKQTLTKPQRDYLFDPKIEVNCDWTDSDNYSPETAENIRPTLQ